MLANQHLGSAMIVSPGACADACGVFNATAKSKIANRFIVVPLQTLVTIP